MRSRCSIRRFVGLCLLAIAALLPLAPTDFAAARPAGKTNGAGIMADMPCCPPEGPMPADCADICPLQALCAAQRLAGFIRDSDPLPQRLASTLNYGSPPSIRLGNWTIPPDIPPPRS
jgi:hypothetical protein